MKARLEKIGAKKVAKKKVSKEETKSEKKDSKKKSEKLKVKPIKNEKKVKKEMLVDVIEVSPVKMETRSKRKSFDIEETSEDSASKKRRVILIS